MKQKRLFLDSDFRDKTIYSVRYLIITIKCGELVWIASRYLHRWDQELFYWCYLSHQSHPLVCIILKLNFLPNSPFGKKWCMLNLTIFFPCWAPHLTVICILDHDKLVDHKLSNNRTYILLFICAYLKGDKEGSSHGFKWVRIPLKLYQYISYIVPRFLIPKFLYSYISEARSCLAPCNHCLDLLVCDLNRTPNCYGKTWRFLCPFFRNLHLRENLARDCFTSIVSTVTNSVQNIFTHLRYCDK